MNRVIHLLVSCLIIVLIVGCQTSADNSGNTTPDYDKTKQMLIDLLKTDEGKKAIQDLMKEDEMRQALVIDNDFVKETVQKTLISEAGKKFWEELLKDPEFAKTFAESMKTENEKMLKALMKDPEYQAMMISILKDPEMEKAVLELMKSKEYRQQVMTIMTEALESPLFKAKISEILEKVAQKQMTKEKEGENEKKEGGSGKQSS